MEKVDVINFCHGCPRLSPEDYCTVYHYEGQVDKVRKGYCPFANRYAEWRTDKPVKKEEKKRVGQLKTKRKKG